MEKRTMARIVAMAIAFILIAGIACVALVTCSSGTPFSGLRTNAVNTVLDTTGFKERVDGELRNQAARISEETGIPVEILETGVDMIDVTHWQAADLPADAVESGSFDLQYAGQNVTVTAYEDPSYVTIGAWGQAVTFDVPKSTQTFTKLAPYLDGMHDLDLGDLISM